MKLKKSSLLIRWAYLLDNIISANATSPNVRHSFQMPKNTNACIIFWRGVVLTPLAIVLTLPAAGIGMLVIMVMGACYLIRDIYRWSTTRETAQWMGDKTDDAFQVIGAGFKSFHKKTCPLVEIDD